MYSGKKKTSVAMCRRCARGRLRECAWVSSPFLFGVRARYCDHPNPISFTAHIHNYNSSDSKSYWPTVYIRGLFVYFVGLWLLGYTLSGMEVLMLP